MRSRRSLVSAVSFRAVISKVFDEDVPEVASRPARMCIIVDLPEPRGLT